MARKPKLRTEEKLKRLKEALTNMGSVLIAYSGGADSTLLASVASEALGQRAMVVLARSPLYPPRECQDAEDLAGKLGFRFATIETNELEKPQFVANSPDRCYYCKQELFQELRRIASGEDLDWVADGSNYDDLRDYRPGRKALAELGIRSPLCEVKLTKSEIRGLSRKMGLSTWDKPASPCLASRIPYGTPVTGDTLRRIAEGERYLRNLGIRDCRLRHHGNIARIEVNEKEMSPLLNSHVRRALVRQIRTLGYTYVSLDLGGYRSGSLDEELIKDIEGRK